MWLKGIAEHSTLYVINTSDTSSPVPWKSSTLLEVAILNLKSTNTSAIMYQGTTTLEMEG